MHSLLFRTCALLLTCSVFVCLAASPNGRAAAPPPVLTDAQARARDLDHRILAESRKDSSIVTNLTYLCDQIGPRLTTSPSLNRASAWTVDQMRNLGLTNVHLEPWMAPEGWKRGAAVARLIEPDNGRAINMASLAWYPGTKGKVEGDVVIVKAQTMKELEAYKGKLKNAIILSGPPPAKRLVEQILNPTPQGRRPRMQFDRTKGGANFAEMREVQKARGAFLKKEGVAAILQCSPRPLGRLFTTGNWQGTERAATENRLPTLYVADNHYDMLYRLASRPAPAHTRMELEVTNTFIPGPIAVTNTVGEIKGTDKSDEFVICGAHLDSWDLGQGATDNGTGTCIVLETARILMKSGVKPRRTIRFVLFTGEEQGLHGSRNYVEQHKDEMKKVSCALVHDTGTGRVYGIGCGGRPMVQNLFTRELTALQGLGVTDYRRPSGGGSDHMSFDRAGVPGFMFVQEPAGYFLSHHTEADTLDLLREGDAIQGAQVMSVAAMRIANLDEMLPREKVERGRGRFGR
jgi:carboxypeptidase Q